MEIFMKKIYLTAVLLLIILVSAFVYYNYGYFYTHFYSGTRIKGTYSISVNGKNARPLYKYIEYENSGKTRLLNDDNTFEIDGGKYGVYSLGLVLDNSDTFYSLTNDEYFLSLPDKSELIIAYSNTNWWNIINADIDIDIINENGEWYLNYSAKYEFFDENKHYKKTFCENSNKFKYTDIDNEKIFLGA